MESELMILQPPTRQTKPIERWRNAKPLLRELARTRWKKLFLGTSLVIISRASALVMPAAVKVLLDDVIGKRRVELLGPAILAVMGAAVVAGSCSLVVTRLLGKEGLRMVADLRCKVQRHVGRLRLSYFDHHKVGSLLARIMLDLESVRNLLGIGLIDFLGGILTALFSVVYLVTIDASLAACVLIFVAGSVWTSRFLLGRLAPIYHQIALAHAETTGRLSESLYGIRVVKGYRAEAQEARAFEGLVQRLLRTSLRSMEPSSWLALWNAVFLGTGSACILFVGTRQILAGTLTPGGLVTFTALVALVTAPSLQLPGVGAVVAEAIACLDRTQDLLGETDEDANPKRQQPLRAIQGLVSFRNVCFSYEPGRRVLDDISFDAQPGTVTAFVGPSGAGKSTIIGLLMAFYEPSGGVILLDGQDLSCVTLDSYRRQLGVVLQDTFLFDGTIRENVAFARPGAPDSAVIEACRVAHVDEFAERFPDKYETKVGERGVRLSGGQRQRISIARAILADPRILILDEATSSLDSKSESAIRDSLAYLMRGRTTFVIAHRLSTIHQADQILLIEDGRNTERGTHEELYAMRNKYYDLYARQYDGAMIATCPDRQNRERD